MAMGRWFYVLLAAGALALAGYKAWHSDTLYFYLHKSALEALAQESFGNTGIKQLSRAQGNEPHWFVNSDLVSSDLPATQKTAPERPAYNVDAYFAQKSIARATHDALYRKLESLALEGLFVNPDRHTVEFYRAKQNGQRVSYFYSEGGELDMPDLVSYKVIQLDPHWALRRY